MSQALIVFQRKAGRSVFDMSAVTWVYKDDGGGRKRYRHGCLTVTSTRPGEEEYKGRLEETRWVMITSLGLRTLEDTAY